MLARDPRGVNAAPRQRLLQLLQAGIASVEGRQVTRLALQREHLPDEICVFAVGKAAAPMACGASDALGARLRSALVIGPGGHDRDVQRRVSGARWIESAHPLPDQRSLAAGDTLLQAVQSLDPQRFPLFLISGGASSVVEVLRDGVTLQDLRRRTEHGLASGADIESLNQMRAGLSRLKAGGLTRALRGRAALALFISDVPGDSPELIGSGLLGHVCESPADAADCVERRIVANVDMAGDAVVAAARAQGMHAVRRPDRFAGDACDVAAQILREFAASDIDLLVAGGETTVQLPQQTGRGGRNQHLALAAALRLAGHDDCYLLAAGTDGVDGNTVDAGALIDGDSCARIDAEGIDPALALQCAESGTALAASCDLIHTGPTGTNVGDLILVLRWPTGAARHAASPSGMV